MTRRQLAIVLIALLAALLATCARPKPRPEPAATPACQRLDRVQGALVEVECSGTDTDEDGLDDAADLCPRAPETHNGEDDEDGCPDPDADQDQIRDAEDDCPHQAGPPPTGCPIHDADGDGFADHLDSCPLDPEDLNGLQDQDGCPDGADVVVVARQDTLYIKQPVHFLRKSAMLLPDSKELLERVATQLKPHASRIGRVRVVGHCDRREVKRRKIEALSRTRARMVARYLIFQGLDAKLFETESLGSKRRASKGRKKRDHEKNQRVELLVTLLPPKASPVPPVAPLASSADAGVAGGQDAASPASTSPDAGPAARGDAASPGPAADAGASSTAADAGSGVVDAATGKTGSPAKAGVEPYDEGEDWDEEFLEENWDQKFLEK